MSHNRASPPSFSSGCPVKQARVAILLASFNGAAFIGAQLESLASQRWPDWRLVVSDDASSDRTRVIVAEFARRHPGRDIRLIDGPRQGATRNFLALIGQAEPDEWVAFCDQDDAWMPHRLERGMAMIGSAEGAAATSSRTIICDDALQPVTPAPLFRRPPSFRNALVQACLPGNTFLANPEAAALLRDGAGAAARAGVISHDWWAYQLLTGAGALVVRDPEPTVLYRQHRGNAMGRNDTLRARIARIAMLGSGDYGGWLQANIRALQAARELLTPENAALLDEFQAALALHGPVAAARLSRMGLYRQTTAGTLALLAAAAGGKLRPTT